LKIKELGMKFETLYGKSSTGKIKEWSIEVVKYTNGTAAIETTHGYVDGKKQFDVRDVTSGKNIGKSNETTAYEQAVSEARSAYNKKVDEGYVTDTDNFKDESDGLFLPMLAHKWQDHGDKVKFPAYCQPKLDGFRQLSRKEDGKVRLWSRKGKETTIPKEIIAELDSVLKEGEKTDGELYKHGWGFQRIASAIKKYGPDTKLLEYHIYDTPELAKSFKDRFLDRYGSVPTTIGGTPVLIPGTTRLVLVPTPMVANFDEMTQAESKAIEAGYEGLMVRTVTGLYKFKDRSKDLLKVKQFEDAEFEIIGGKEGQGRESGMVIFKCCLENGTEFDVRPRGTEEERSNMWNNLDSYIGKKLTVKYQGFSDSGRPRFPVGLHVRPDWD
jgi:DNA ligase-1